MADINYDDLSEEELSKVKITFTPRKCPKCKKVMACRELGVWGYFCIDCMFWWGSYEDDPEVKKNK